MDRGAQQATVHGIARVRNDLATKPPSPFFPAIKFNSPLKGKKSGFRILH